MGGKVFFERFVWSSIDSNDLSAKDFPTSDDGTFVGCLGVINP